MPTRPQTSPLLLSPTLEALAPHSLATAAARRRTGATGPSALVGTLPPADVGGSARDDALAPFVRLVTALRWLAVAISTAGLLMLAHQPTAAEITVLVVCTGWTAFRSAVPLRHVSGHAFSNAAVLAELVLAAMAVVQTGSWDSPFVPFLLPGIAIAGLAWTDVTVGLVAMAQAVLVGAADLAGRHDIDATTLRPTVRGAGELVLVAVVAGFGRRIVVKVTEQRSEAHDHVSRLSEANTLLYSLHQVAQSLPASLDLEDVLQSTVENVRNLFDTQVVAVLLLDETSPSWLVGRVEGLRLPASLVPEQLPPGVQLALQTDRTVALSELPPDERRGLAPGVRSGLYAPLRPRDHVVAVLISEHADEGHDDPATVELMQRVAEPASLAIDNARWFARLRTVAADEERGRIARDLHDRIGQMLAYLGFELDRLAKQARDGGADPVAGQLDLLRTDVRRVVSEVRETLYDLRTDVSDGHGLIPTLQSFLDRVAARTTIDVRFEHSDDGTALPFRLERELWRIAQEAVTNVERHANATRLCVRWRCDADAAHLEVEDDGKGFGAGEGRVDSYGMRGIRERAAAINARLDINSEPGRGTTVRCRLATRPAVPPAPTPTTPALAATPSR